MAKNIMIGVTGLSFHRETASLVGKILKGMGLGARRRCSGGF